MKIDIPKEHIAEFCERWKITEFALFGSVLREDFGPESDIDVLVTFTPDAPWSLLDELPDDVSFEEIQYHIDVREKVEAGRQAVREGRLVSEEEVERRMGDAAYHALPA